MAIPEEHKSRVAVYANTVARLVSQINESYSRQGFDETFIANNETKTLITANNKAAEILGYSYYPWPFASDN